MVEDNSQKGWVPEEFPRVNARTISLYVNLTALSRDGYDSWDYEQQLSDVGRQVASETVQCFGGISYDVDRGVAVAQLALDRMGEEQGAPLPSVEVSDVNAFFLEFKKRMKRRKTPLDIRLLMRKVYPQEIDENEKMGLFLSAISLDRPEQDIDAHLGASVMYELHRSKWQQTAVSEFTGEDDVG